MPNPSASRGNSGIPGPFKVELSAHSPPLPPPLNLERSGGAWAGTPPARMFNIEREPQLSTNLPYLYETPNLYGMLCGNRVGSRPEIGRHRPRCGRNRPETSKIGEHRFKLGQIRAQSGRSRPGFGRNRPNLAKLGPNVAGFGSHVRRCRSKSSGSPRNPLKSAEFGGLQPMSCQTRSESGRTLSKFGRCRSQIWPRSVKRWRNPSQRLADPQPSRIGAGKMQWRQNSNPGHPCSGECPADQTPGQPCTTSMLDVL